MTDVFLFFSQFAVFIFGLIIGSFLNVIIYRTLLPARVRRRTRSFCPHCQKELRWFDLIPIFSFIRLGGKCRYCQKSISWQYPLIELTTAILFLLIFNFSPQPKFGRGLIFYWITSCFLILIFVIDFKHYFIPDKFIYPLIAITFFYRLSEIRIRNLELGIFYPFSVYFLSAIGASLFFFAIFLISRGKWLGFGDVKLAFFMGLFLGFPKILVAFFLSFFLGAIIGIGLILAGRKKLKSEIPFGPFLVTATFLALFWGDRVVEWYLQQLLA